MRWILLLTPIPTLAIDILAGTDLTQNLIYCLCLDSFIHLLPIPGIDVNPENFHALDWTILYILHDTCDLLLGGVADTPGPPPL